MKWFRSLIVMAAVASFAGLLSENAFAGGRLPGSLLIYVTYDSAPASGTLISITNSKDDPSFNPNTNLNSVVDVHFVYIDGVYWTEFNRFERLTPNDEFSVTANYHNPNSERGFIYAFALDPTTQEPITFNWLIGDEIVVDGQGNFLYALDAIAFKGLTAAGTPTDVNTNDILDLDGSEYEKVADFMMISSFIGTAAPYRATLIVVALVPSSDYRTTIDFDVYNDNEQEFSATYDFRCWAEVALSDIDNVFDGSFLTTTNTDPNAQSLPFETGWARIDGDRAVDVVGNEPQISDPPFVGAIINSIAIWSGAHLLHESDSSNPTNGVLNSLQ